MHQKWIMDNNHKEDKLPTSKKTNTFLNESLYSALSKKILYEQSTRVMRKRLNHLREEIHRTKNKNEYFHVKVISLITNFSKQYEKILPLK